MITLKFQLSKLDCFQKFKAYFHSLTLAAFSCALEDISPVQNDLQYSIYNLFTILTKQLFNRPATVALQCYHVKKCLL